MIWLTWAPASENVITVRWWSRMRCTSRGSSLLVGWKKNTSKLGFQTEIEHRLDGVRHLDRRRPRPRSADSLPSSPITHEALEEGLLHRLSAKGEIRSPTASTRARRTSGSRNAAACSVNGRRRTSAQAASLSNGNHVAEVEHRARRADSFAWPPESARRRRRHRRAVRAAPCHRLGSPYVVMPNVVGTFVATARARSRCIGLGASPLDRAMSWLTRSTARTLRHRHRPSLRPTAPTSDHAATRDATGAPGRSGHGARCAMS